MQARPAERGTVPASLRLALGNPERRRPRAMAGTTDKIKGAVKEGAGKLTGDSRTETEGETDQAKGDVKNAARDVKDAAKGARDSIAKK